MTIILNTSALAVLMNLLALFPTSEKSSTSEIHPFQIETIKTKNEIKLTCISGCAWKTLEFTKNDFQPQLIDQYGMLKSIEEHAEKKDDQLADFVFTISKSHRGILLEGKKGTAWKKLSFTANNYVPTVVTEKGMKE